MSPSSQLERAVAGQAPARRCFFGVAAVDETLPPEGMSEDTQVLVAGETGVGKTVLATQFLYEGLLVGDRCIYVACDEAPDQMRLAMANFHIGTQAYERERRLQFVDAYSRERSSERLAVHDPRDLDELFACQREAVELLGPGPIRLVVDSLSTPFGTLPRNAVLEFNRHRLRYLWSRRVLTLDNFVTGLLDEQLMAGLSHSYPLLLRMGFHETGGALQRYLQLGKMRSGMFSGERRSFRIDARTGIVAQR